MPWEQHVYSGTLARSTVLVIVKLSNSALPLPLGSPFLPVDSSHAQLKPKSDTSNAKRFENHSSDVSPWTSEGFPTVFGNHMKLSQKLSTRPIVSSPRTPEMPQTA